MTDTTILEGMMQALKRNPLTRERMGHLSKNEVREGEAWGTDRQQVVTDDRPFYARGEVVRLADANPRFAAAVDVFHEDLSAPRKERPRQGSCPRRKQEFDGERWVVTEACGGTVHAVETIVGGAIRVDGKCLSCGTEIHRAGLLSEKG
jgi:hypothetical protein